MRLSVTILPEIVGKPKTDCNVHTEFQEIQKKKVKMKRDISRKEKEKTKTKNKRIVSKYNRIPMKTACAIVQTTWAPLSDDPVCIAF